MSNSVIIRSDIHPYHITSRTPEKTFFPLALNEMWPIVLRRLHQCHLNYSLAVHGFVLMGNHFHLLCHTPLSNIDVCMHFFLRATSMDVAIRRKKFSPLWDHRYRWSVIDSQTHYYQVYRYIFQNPIRAGLVKRVEEYPFTTLKPNIPFPLHSTIPMSFGGHEGELHWLNEKYEDEDLRLIKTGLKHAQFSVEKRKLKAFNKLSVPG